MDDERLFAVRLLWVKDPEMFARYQKLAKPVLARHGVHIERWLMTENIEGEGMEKPDEIVITWFDNPRKKEEFENDPEYKIAAQIRDKAVKLVTITAKSALGD
ncbi:MAG: DUF1330 domain-containing protein [Deltaproteobacteria bacterium]|nr:DUF1330 domain-containing protein [Deltaproteobacteria bacterium]MCK5709540.1 DUF1330 domain-containing protein [Deltaproteobacteria bacterium]